MQKQESAGPELQWLWNILEEAKLPETVRTETDIRPVRAGPDLARSQALWHHCRLSDQRLRYGFNPAKFGRFLTTYGVEKVRRYSGVLSNFHRLARSALNSWK